MTTLTSMVNISGRWFSLLSAHSALNSSLWFFFTTIARRKGDMASIVSRAHSVLAAHGHCGSRWMANGRKKDSMSAMTVMESME